MKLIRLLIFLIWFIVTTIMCFSVLPMLVLCMAYKDRDWFELGKQLLK